MYCHQGNPKLSGDATADVTDFVMVRFEKCSDPKLRCWSSDRQDKFINGKMLRILVTKNFIK